MKQTISPGLSLVVAAFIGLALLPLGQARGDAETGWREALAADIAAIDAEMPGQLGVYVFRLEDGQSVAHRSDREWYLASTIKLPLGIALMQRVEAGELALDDELELAQSDFVDGAGDLLWQEPGSRFTLDELNLRSIRDSDSTATDMLIRLLGEDDFNRQISDQMVANGFGPITTIVQVRYDAFSEIHPAAAELDNMAVVELRGAGDLDQRYQALLERLGIEAEDAAVGSLNEAFQRYYTRGLNSGSLESFGLLLKRLLAGELLNEAHTHRLIEIMASVNTGDRRIKAGLPAGAEFAHKTGTQIGRACDIGIVNPARPEGALIVAACAEDYDDIGQAERAFAALGAALGRHGLISASD